VIRKYSVRAETCPDVDSRRESQGSDAWVVASFSMRQRSCPSIMYRTAGRLLVDAVRLVSLGFRSRSGLVAESLSLRKQLALYQERRVKSRRADDATRITLVVLSHLIDWRAALTIVKPDTLIRWHRRGFRLFWRWKSRARGRPPLPADLQQLIAAMARANVTWGEERIAAELHLKLGLRVSPRTVRRYMARGGTPRDHLSSQRWSTFVRNHVGAMLACDFFVTITAMFRTLYVFVVLDVGTRRIVHWKVTEHPTAEWTVQQFRAVVPGDQLQRFLIHDRDSIYSSAVDDAVAAMGLTVLKTPARCPQANAFCERLIGTIRRECLDWLILLNERHVRSVLREWVAHYNRGRPHASLGPGIPDAPLGRPTALHGRRIPHGHRVEAAPILAGLHHEYRLESFAA
jgi:putative transposase